MQSHLFATPQILFVGLVDDFSKNPGYSPDMLWGIHTTGMNYLIKLMETHKKEKRGVIRKKGVIRIQELEPKICHQYLLGWR